MSRPKKIALMVARSIAGFVLIIFLAAIIIVQTPWFRNTVRAKIVSAVEDATGGRVEVGSFSFEWTHLRAVVRDFVLHGTEPPTSAPLFRARLLEVDLKLTSPFHGFVDIAYLGLDAPQANVIVYPDGRTNVPSPKVKSTSNKSGLETVVDLAIGDFRLTNGSVVFADRKLPLSATGRNLRARFSYNTIKPGYQGQVSMNPLFLQSGTIPPVAVNVALPVVLEKDSIQLNGARLTTPESEIVISAALKNMKSPETSAHLNARIALEEANRIAGMKIPLDTGPGEPRYLNADIAAAADNNRIQVTTGRLTLGRTSIEASGMLKNGTNPPGLRFRASLALGELGRLLRVAAQPQGQVTLNGEAKLMGQSDYLVSAKVDARRLAIRQGTTRLSGIDLDSSVMADPRLIRVSDLKLAAMGGTVTGSAELANQSHFRANLNLNHFDLQRVAQVFTPQRPAWDGIVSGPVQAEGDIHAIKDVAARARLAIAPGNRGTPVSGRLNASYNGRAGTVDLDHSHIAMPSTRVDLSGSLGRQIQVRLITHNLNDLLPQPQQIPVRFQNGGSAAVTATVTGSLKAPRIAGHVAMTRFAVDDRAFDSFGADLDLTKSGAAVRNGLLVRGQLQARFAGSVGLHQWKPESRDPVAVTASIQNADMKDVLALAGKSDIPVTGGLNASAQISGTVGSPRGNTSLTVANGTAYQEHFDRIAARVNMTDRSIDLPTLEIVASPARLDASGSYRHPVNDLKRGTLQVHLASNQINLKQFQTLQEKRPGLAGTVQIQADATGEVQPSPTGEQFQLVSLNGSASAGGLQMQGKNLGNVTASARTAGTELVYSVNSDFSGSVIKVSGQSLLTGDHATTATASIRNLPIEPVLAIAGRSDISVAGTLATDAQVSGTLADPHASASLTVTNATAYQQKFDRLQAQFSYSNQLASLESLTFIAGPNRVDASGSFSHPPNDWKAGQARFHLATNQVRLAQVEAVERFKPGLAGTLQVSADGAATLRRDASPLVSLLNADLAARGLSVNRKPVGEITASARTSGNELTFKLASDFAKSNIQGNGRMQLAGDYPLSARVTFSNVTYSGLSTWLDTAAKPGVDAQLAGEVDVDGPAATPDNMRGKLQISTLDVHSAPAEGVPPRRNVSLRNSGPIVVALDHSTVRIQSARITGPFTDLSLTGTASIADQRALDLRANGSLHLEVIEAFDRNVFSSGVVALNAAVQGTMAKPAVNGRIQLQNASFNMMGVPNGLTNGTGTIVFTGTEARIENLTGESGGGQIKLAGFIAYGGPQMNFRLHATARRVRVGYPSGVSTQASADITAAGTTSRSLVSGRVRILDVALHSHTDVGSMLSQAATPPSAPTAQSPLMAGMRFDLRIDTAPDVQFQTTLAQNLQADAHLTLRGTPASPGMLGRVNVTEGEIVFFGSKYTVNQGTVGFYNPQKIDPILNVALETQAKGVDVTLSVSGPMDRLKLSYHSDPPLQFSDIVALLATGKVPTTDPVLAANQPAAPQQSLEQKGASAVLGQAVANPVSGRLQRLFGVTQLKIDPEIIGATNIPQARLTLEQQITKQLDFIYIQDVSQSNPELIRIEWDINPVWTAVAERDIYGEFGVDFFYKKRFR